MVQSDSSVGLQYLGLALYVIAQAVLFVPLLYVAQHFTGPEDHVIAKAGIMTLAMFGGLTLAVFVSGKDFSFLRTIWSWGACWPWASSWPASCSISEGCWG